MPVNKLSIAQIEASQIVDAIIRRANHDGGTPVCVAVVDVSARLLAFAAMDGVAPACVKLSQSKAYSAVIGLKDTINWANVSKNAEVIDFDMRNWTDENFSGFTGGIVLISQEKVIGGIGVSGRKGMMSETDHIEQDNELALFGKGIINL
jgi:uncharacterized protein GlcG (DUF336 family)